MKLSGSICLVIFLWFAPACKTRSGPDRTCTADDKSPKCLPKAELPLAPPAGEKAHKATLKWNESDKHVTGYNVFRAEKKGGPYEKIGNVSDRTFVDKSVIGGKTYYYVVTALSKTGESSFSNEATATIPSDNKSPLHSAPPKN